MIDFRLETTFAVGLITVDNNNVVVETAPIFKWMIGKDYEYCKYFYRRKNTFVSSTTI